MLRLAVGYARQSKKKADKSEASPQTQDEAIRRKAPERGCRLLKIYRDIGVSGYDPTVKRKDFEQLLNYCRQNEVHEIIVYNITRFSRREPKDAIPVVLELFSLGITITSVCEGSFSPDNTMELIMLIMRIDAAHQDSKNKSEAISDAKRLAKQFGGWTGGVPPYGMESYAQSVTRVLDGEPVTVTIRLLRPVPRNEDGTDQASIALRMVDRIFEFKDKPWSGKKNGHPASVSAVVAWMNSAGWVGQNGAAWRTPTAKRILSDPRLAGFAAETVYHKDSDGNPTRTLSGYKMLRDEETGEPITIGEALIPPARWFELQKWLRGREWGRSDTPWSEKVLTAMGVLKCECSRPMTGSPRLYKCSRPPGVVEEGKHAGGNTINLADVDDYVARRIMAVLMTAERDEETLDTLAEATRRLAKLRENPAARGERASLVGERREITNDINRLYDDLKAGIYEGKIGRARFLQEKETLEKRQAVIERRIAEVGGPELPALPIAEWTYTEDPNGDPLGEGSWWQKADTADRRMLVSLFVDEVRVRKAAGRGGRNRVCRVEERVSVFMAKPKHEEHEAQESEGQVALSESVSAA
ncbi:recombinase family protein [Streptomyces klenkii]|uniref:Recombinase family protein n=1 Tax=Streptomyces klenkii TaxID=1420899 RepID=A0A3B0BF67_9ACTN|nr:recombinase family protein [Streptomyces klenkii]